MSSNLFLSRTHVIYFFLWLPHVHLLYLSRIFRSVIKRFQIQINLNIKTSYHETKTIKTSIFLSTYNWWYLRKCIFFNITIFFSGGMLCYTIVFIVVVGSAWMKSNFSTSQRLPQYAAPENVEDSPKNKKARNLYIFLRNNDWLNYPVASLLKFRKRQIFSYFLQL